MDNAVYLKGTIVVSEGDMRTALANFVNEMFDKPFEIVSVKPIYTGENAGCFSAEWSEV